MGAKNSKGIVLVMAQVHPVVSRLCAPIEGTDAAHLADCLGLDPAKFRQQVIASSADAREEAQLAVASVFDDDDRYKVSSIRCVLLSPTNVCDLLTCYLQHPAGFLAAWHACNDCWHCRANSMMALCMPVSDTG